MLNSVLLANQCKLYRIENNVLVEEISTFPNGFRNISRGKYIYADNHLPEHLPFSLIDDDDSTYYQSVTQPTNVSPQNLTLKLMGSYAMSKLNIKSVSGIGPKDIIIQSSIDGNTYTTIIPASLKDTGNEQTINFPETDARFFRIVIKSSFGTNTVGINGIELFGYPK